jgi:hypothetical protein
VPRLPCRSLPAFANVEQEQMQQTEAERAKRAAAANDGTSNPDAADQAAMPPAASQMHESKRERVPDDRRLAHEAQLSTHASKHQAKHEALQIARDAHGSKREAKHETSQIAREAHGAKREAKHELSHIAREAHASKHEAAHTPHSARERHRSA